MLNTYYVPNSHQIVSQIVVGELALLYREGAELEPCLRVGVTEGTAWCRTLVPLFQGLSPPSFVPSHAPGCCMKSLASVDGSPITFLSWLVGREVGCFLWGDI